MTVFVDTSVIMYAAGADHPHRDGCRRVLQRVADGDLAAVTSAEVVQEILHRFARGQRDVGQRMAQGVIDLFGDLLPVDGTTVQDAVVRYRSDQRLSARDAIHAATCAVNSIDRIVSVDADFDVVPGLVRVDPSEL